MRPNTLVRLVCAIGLAWLAPAPAQADPAATQPAQRQGAKREPTKPPEITVPLNLALISRVSVNRLSGPNAHNFVSLGLISNDAARLTGLQLGLGASAVDRRVVGVQVGGLVSGAGGDVAGLQLGGLVSGSGGDVAGLQVGGLIAGAGGGVRGLQAGALVSGAGRGMDGLQLSLLVSGAGGEVNGLQVGGLVSGAGGHVHGAQLAGLVGGAPVLEGAQLAVLLNGAGAFSGLQLAGAMNAAGRGSGVQLALGGNYAKRALSGAQIGLVNVGGVVRGAQIGLVNIACHLHGAQVGLVNVSSTANGAIVGPVSYVSSAAKHLELWTSTTAPASVAWRLGRGRVYSLLSTGVHPFAETPRLALAAGTGVELSRFERVAIESDALFHYVLFDYDPGGIHAWLAQLRGRVLYQLRPAMALFAGVSLNAAFSSGSAAGQLAFGPDLDLERGDTTVRVWPGVFLGARL